MAQLSASPAEEIATLLGSPPFDKINDDSLLTGSLLDLVGSPMLRHNLLRGDVKLSSPQLASPMPLRALCNDADMAEGCWEQLDSPSLGPIECGDNLRLIAAAPPSAAAAAAAEALALSLRAPLALNAMSLPPLGLPGVLQSHCMLPMVMPTNIRPSQAPRVSNISLPPLVLQASSVPGCTVPTRSLTPPATVVPVVPAEPTLSDGSDDMSELCGSACGAAGGGGGLSGASTCGRRSGSMCPAAAAAVPAAAAAAAAVAPAAAAFCATAAQSPPGSPRHCSVAPMQVEPACSEPLAGCVSGVPGVGVSGGGGSHGSGASDGGGGSHGGEAGQDQEPADHRLTLNFLEENGYFDMPIQQAAAELGVGVTTLKKVCRTNNIGRWPFRKRSSLNRLIAKTREYFAGDPEQCAEALAQLEAQRSVLRAQQGEDIPDQVKRYRQSIFKLDYKVKKIAKERRTHRGAAAAQLAAMDKAHTIRQLGVGTPAILGILCESEPEVRPAGAGGGGGQEQHQHQQEWMSRRALDLEST